MCDWDLFFLWGSCPCHCSGSKEKGGGVAQVGSCEPLHDSYQNTHNILASPPRCTIDPTQVAKDMLKRHNKNEGTKYEFLRLNKAYTQVQDGGT